MSDLETIKLNEVEYVRSDKVPQVTANGNRAVIVVDRGWIWAGDVTEENGRIYLDRAVWCFRWSSIGFDGLIADPSSSNADIRKMNNRVDIPADAEIFRIPVNDNWGL